MRKASQGKPSIARNPKAQGYNPKPALQSQAQATFDTLRQEFLRDLDEKVRVGAASSNTLWTYEKRLEFFQRQMGVELLSDVTRPLVQRFLEGLRAGSLPDSRKPASTSYVDNHWRHLVGFLKWCRRRGYVVEAGLFERDDQDRLRFAITQPIIDETDIQPWPEDEIEAIRDAARFAGVRDQVLVEIFLRTGIRLAEQSRLELEHIQGEALRIVGSKSVRGRRVRTQRWVPLYPEPRRMLRAWVERHRPSSPTERVWVQADGSPLTARGIDSLLDRVHRRAGVSGGAAHRYRHTFATYYLVKNPGQLPKLKEYLGHSDFRMVERYAHLAQRIRRGDFSDAREDPFA